MIFEHFALNVPDSKAMCSWYADHVGFKIAVSRGDEAATHFLSDSTGRIVVELYSKPTMPVPDFASAHPLAFHFAVATTAAQSERLRLEKAGATWVSEDLPPDGSVLIMMRDPWGVPLQLCQRAKPFPLGA